MAIFNLSDPPPIELAQGEPDPSPPAGPRFPFKTVLGILVLLAALVGWHWYVDHGKGLDPGIFWETFRLTWPHPPAPVVPKTPTIHANANGKLPQVSAVFADDSNSLDPFFAALWALEQRQLGQTNPEQRQLGQANPEQRQLGQANPEQRQLGQPSAEQQQQLGQPGPDPPKASIVTVLHYGDSPTTADLITGDVRAQLQERFGDAGRGYTLIAKPWAWYGHRGVEISDHGWKIRHGVGLMREGVYGLGGAAFEGQPGAWSKFRLTESQQSAVNVEYLAKPGGGSFAVEADDHQLADQSTDSQTQTALSLHVELPAGTRIVSIRPTSGTVTLFGADFRRGSTGLLYDSLGLNGATTSVVARVLQPAIWRQELGFAAPTLVVINYGSNESSFGSFVHKQYAGELRLAIQRVRANAPAASILIMSPMDRGERSGLDEIQTMATIPEIVAIQRQVAAETHVAFFDTYDAMGGDGTMARWYAASPRLVTADLLHPTPQGANIVATLFVEQLGLGYNRWKTQHGIALPAPSATITPKADATTAKPKSKPATKHTGKKARKK
jgi:lysophospholipase L1-like esterase